MIHGAETLPGSCLEGSASMAFKSAASQARPPRSRRAQSQRRTPRRLAPQPRDAHTAPPDRHPPALAQRLRASPCSFVSSVVNLADQATRTIPDKDTYVAATCLCHAAQTVQQSRTQPPE